MSQETIAYLREALQHRWSSEEEEEEEKRKAGEKDALHEKDAVERVMGSSNTWLLWWGLWVFIMAIVSRA